MVGRVHPAVAVFCLLPLIAASTFAGGQARAQGIGADNIGSVRASIAAQEAEITARSQAIHRFTTAYQQAQLQSATLGQEMTTARHSLRNVEAEVDATRAALRQDAVRAYTGGVRTAPEVVRVNPAIGAEYLTVVSGDVSQTIDQLNLQQRQVGTDELQLKQEERANRIAVANAAKARRQALAVAAAEQTRLDALQSRLRQLQSEAAAATAAASRARADSEPADSGATGSQAAGSQATGSQATGSQATGSGATGSGATAQADAKAAAARVLPARTATQGAPVDNGLLNSVTSQLSATPPTTAAPAPTTTTTAGPPVTAPPTSGAPVTAPATSAAPLTAPPTSGAPVTAPPTSRAAVTAPPTSGAPVTAPPSSAAPATAPRTTAPPATAPSTTAAPPPAASPVSGSLASDLAELRMCESSDNYTANTGNGFYGAYQFTQQTWTGLGYPGRPDLEPPAMQDEAAAQLATTVGWSQWPACSAELGLSGVA